MKAPRALAALGTTLVLAGSAVLSGVQTPTWGAPATPVPTPSPAALAASAAARIVAARPSFLHASAKEQFSAAKPVTVGAAQYVAYHRTYAGLPVVGGDFVLALDGAGHLAFTSVALSKPIGSISVTPSVSKATAEALARRQLRTVDQVEDTHLLVYALATPARLAWESIVDGRGREGASRLSVFTDAQTGALLQTSEHVMHGSGKGVWNGPNPLRIGTTFSNGVYSMRDPNLADLRCGDNDTGDIFTKSTDLWGNGKPKNRETDCVDALFGANAEAQMLHEWLGRDGMDGSGGAWPIFVGLDDNNAFYNGRFIAIGHNNSGQWIGSLDIIGHEMGHGIDDSTPGGISNGNTKEFIADAFGTATEWYANEKKPFDVPDFLIGEQINLYGDGAMRNMAKPSAIGAPDCYSSRIPTQSTEVHDAAGPGNHWFYLLAEGNKPTDGQPKSPTCNKSDVTGLGVRNAIRILYNAMLLKNSSSSYLKYRVWTLQAAKDLFPTSCAEYNKVKAAWDAVKVPAQRGEPTCSAFEVAFQANTQNLSTAGSNPGGDLQLGMMAGTSPSIVNLADGGYEVAFQAKTGHLWTTGTAGAKNWGLGMMAGTSPSITALPNGGYQVAFQAQTGGLWTAGTPGVRDWKLSMKAGTSPAITTLTNGKTEIAFQADTGKLWTIGGSNHGAWTVSMKAGTSPSITPLVNAGYQVAVQASSGKLWTVGTPGTHNWALRMKEGTSPAITTLSTGQTEIAFQASTGNLWTVGGDNHRNWGLSMSATSSPAIAAQGSGKYVTVFQANTGNLWKVTGAGGTDLRLGMLGTTSPAVTG